MIDQMLDSLFVLGCSLMGLPWLLVAQIGAEVASWLGSCWVQTLLVVSWLAFCWVQNLLEVSWLGPLMEQTLMDLVTGSWVLAFLG